MKIVIRLLLVFMLVIVAAPAYAAEATQMWRCELDDDATEKEVLAGAAKWLKAAKTMKGGENLKAHLYFPIAVNATGEMDAMFVVVAPTFEEWGRFWDNYEGSAAAAQDKENEKLVVCPDSVLWESTAVK